jgi:hypothetical protein
MSGEETDKPKITRSYDPVSCQDMTSVASHPCGSENRNDKTYQNCKYGRRTKYECSSVRMTDLCWRKQEGRKQIFTNTAAYWSSEDKCVSILSLHFMQPEGSLLCKIRSFHSGDYEVSLQPPAHAGSSLAHFSTLKMEVIPSYKKSVNTWPTRRHTTEDGIILSFIIVPIRGPLTNTGHYPGHIIPVDTFLQYSFTIRFNTVACRPSARRRPWERRLLAAVARKRSANNKGIVFSARSAKQQLDTTILGSTNIRTRQRHYNNDGDLYATRSEML